MSRQSKSLLFLAWLGILVLCAYAASNTGIGRDYVRDVVYASRIANGLEFPAAGPVFNNTLQLGPLWFYLCAIPILLGGGYQSVAVFIALLGACKYFLAYQVGRRLIDDRFGALVATAVFISGWTWMPLKMPTHSAVGETAAWGLLLVGLIWWKQPGPARSFALGLVASLCLHAHPTHLPLVLASTGVALALAVRRRSTGVFCAFTTGGLLPVLPYLALQTVNGWPDVGSASQYAGSHMALPSLARTAETLLGVLVNGHSHELQYSAHYSGGNASVLAFSYAAVVIAGLAMLAAQWLRGGTIETRERRLVGAALLAFVAQFAFLLLARPFMTFWMLFSLLPFLALCVALGLRAMIRTRPGSLAAVIFIVTAVALVLDESRIYRKADYDTLRLPEEPFKGLIDIKDRPVGGTLHRWAIFHARHVNTVRDKSLAFSQVHGQAATMLDESFAAFTQPAPREIPTLGGVGDGPGPGHIAGFYLPSWKRLGREAAETAGGMAWVRPAGIVAPVKGLPLAGPQSTRDAIAKRAVPQRSAQTHVFETACSAVVAITNMVRGYQLVSSIDARVDGAPVKPLFDDGATVFFRSAPCASPAKSTWHLRIDGPADGLDIIWF